MSHRLIHDVYAHINTALQDPNSNKNLVDVFSSCNMENRELTILIAAIDLQTKKFNDDEYFKYALLPGEPIGLKAKKCLYNDNSIPPNLGKIKGIIFSDKVPNVIYFDHHNPFVGIYKTISHHVFAEDISNYICDNKTYKIWAPDWFSINSQYADGIKFLRFDQEIDMSTIGFVLQLQKKNNEQINTNSDDAIKNKRKREE